MILRTPSSRPEFAEALQSRSIACGPIETDPNIGEPLLPLAIALNDLVHGEVKAIMLCKVRLRVFLDLVQDYSQPPDVQVLITGLDNRILAATDFSQVLCRPTFQAQPMRLRCVRDLTTIQPSLSPQPWRWAGICSTPLRSSVRMKRLPLF